MAKIRITLIKSPIGYNKKQRATAVALGLKKLQATVVQEDTPDIMGKIASIAHLVKWEPCPVETLVKAAPSEEREVKPVEIPVETPPKRAPKIKAHTGVDTAAEKKAAADMVAEALMESPNRPDDSEPSQAPPEKQE